MQIKVSRTYFYIAACVCVWLFWLINRVTIIHNGRIAQGLVEKTRCQQVRNPYCYPLISFQYQGNRYLFEAEADLDLRKGDTVAILHTINKPSQAWVWSFGGFWVVSIIVALLFTLLINALVYSFVRNQQFFLISFPFKSKQIISESSNVSDNSNELPSKFS